MTRAHFVVFAHGTDIWSPLPTIRRWALRRADRVVCVSAFTAERAIQANGVSRRKVLVLHNCLDPYFTTNGRASNPDGNPSLLTVARISSADGYKGHDQVIRALPALLKMFPNLVYDIVGEGDGRSALETLAMEQGVSHAVHFHGVVSEEDLASYYANTSIYVMPSRGEGFGLAFAEAMAYGKPTIAGNEDASVEVVLDGETGLLVSPTDTSEITRAILRLLSDDDLRHQMGMRGAEVVHRDFSFPSFRMKLLDLLGDLAPRPIQLNTKGARQRP